MAWVALPRAYGSTNIVLLVITVRKRPWHRKAVVLEEVNHNKLIIFRKVIRRLSTANATVTFLNAVRMGVTQDTLTAASLSTFAWLHAGFGFVIGYIKLLKNS
jgi:hypothetical protein